MAKRYIVSKVLEKSESVHDMLGKLALDDRCHVQEEERLQKEEEARRQTTSREQAVR